MNPKYVVYEDHFGTTIAIIFSSLIDHCAVIPGCKQVLGAGFCKYRSDGSVECYGKSVTLNTPSRGDEDAAELRRIILG